MVIRYELIALYTEEQKPLESRLKSHVVDSLDELEKLRKRYDEEILSGQCHSYDVWKKMYDFVDYCDFEEIKKKEINKNG